MLSWISTIDKVLTADEFARFVTIKYIDRLSWVTVSALGNLHMCT